uniref:Uncharacterized protein n=1 Tax=Anguilla anguilla TaxID=7936 RepID=A0A0E9Q4V8_ANGAN
MTMSANKSFSLHLCMYFGWAPFELGERF